MSLVVTVYNNDCLKLRNSQNDRSSLATGSCTPERISAARSRVAESFRSTAQQSVCRCATTRFPEYHDGCLN